MKNLSKTEQILFYQAEIRKILEDYKLYLDSKCSDLINKDELYIGVFEYIDSIRSQVVFSFPSLKLPATKIPLTASIPVSEEVLVKDLEAITYNAFRSKFVKSYTDCYGVYYHEYGDKINVGFTSFDLQLVNSLTKGDRVVFGRADPPLKYYFNLIHITKNDVKSRKVEEVICGAYHSDNFEPINIDNSLDLIERYKNDLKNEDTVIIQGPPGTGKTFFISRLLEVLNKENKTVLVATLANRSLIELAKKYFEIENVNRHVLYKSNLTLEESREVKELMTLGKDYLPSEGAILLTTYYKLAAIGVENTGGPIYDYIILEESSQSFLGTIAAARLLGKKVILVGDPLQLPPVVNQEKADNISPNIDLMLESFTFYASTVKCPKFRLTTTYRFSKNACAQTNTFYENSLKSKSYIQDDNKIFSDISPIFNQQGGCSLYYYDSSNMSGIYSMLFTQIKALFQINSKFEIAILSSTRKGVKLLRDNLLPKIQDSQDNILVNTVDGVQGLTVDFCFYFAYSEGNPAFAFKVNRFNVATSRARYCTLILLDEVYKMVQPYKGLVAEFISKCQLDTDSSVHAFNTKYEKDKDIPSISPGLKVIDKIDLSKWDKPKKEIVKGKENIYIIDTNVFIESPDIISKIDSKYSVVLSAKVIDELDYLKISLPNEQKLNVQKALRLINDGIDKRGIKMETAELSLLPSDFSKKSPDNLILSVALKFKSENPIILTSDNGLQIKAKGLGIMTITLRDFLRQKKY